MHRRTALAAGWGLYGLALLAPAASAQPDRFWQYDVLVDRYRQGHHGESVQALGTWPRRRLCGVEAAGAGAPAPKEPDLRYRGGSTLGPSARADAMLDDLRKEVSP